MVLRGNFCRTRSLRRRLHAVSTAGAPAEWQRQYIQQLTVRSYLPMYTHTHLVTTRFALRVTQLLTVGVQASMSSNILLKYDHICRAALPCIMH